MMEDKFVGWVAWEPDFNTFNIGEALNEVIGDYTGPTHFVDVLGVDANGKDQIGLIIAKEAVSQDEAKAFFAEQLQTFIDTLVEEEGD